MQLKKIHYVSGVTISLFTVLHLINHLFSLFGTSTHIELMNYLRVVYRNVIAETILVLAVLVQIISGIKLFLSKRKSKTVFFAKLKMWSGLYLALFLLIHLGVVFLGRIVLKLDTNFYFGAAGLNTFPFNLFFIPYYGLAIISFFGHIAAVHSIKMKRKILGIDPIKQSYAILMIGVALTLLILFGLTNGFTGFKIPAEYNIMIGK